MRWWSGGQEHALQSGVLRPAHFGDGGVDVVEEQLHEPVAPTRCIATEVDQPPVMGLQPGPAALVLIAATGRRGGEGGRGIEGLGRVGEDDLADDPE